MAKAIKTYAGGINGLVQAAVRADGAMFKRYQDKSPWGYKWGSWKLAGQVDPNNLPAEISSGFSTLRPTNVYSSFNPRLPA